MKLPILQRKNVTRVPQIASAGDGQRAWSQAFGQVAQTLGQIGKQVEQQEVEDAKEQAAIDFASAANDREDLAPINLPSRDKKRLWFRYQDQADRAYNEVAKSLRMDRAIDDYQAKMSELQQDPNLSTDAGAFRKAMTEFGKSYLGGMLREEREVMEDTFNGILTPATQKIALARQEQDLKEFEGNAIRRINNNTEDIGVILEKEGFDAIEDPEVQEKLKQARDKIEAMRAHPWLGYSDEWAEEQLANLEEVVTTASLAGEALVVAEAAYLTGGKEAAEQALQDLTDSFGREMSLDQLDKATARADAWVAGEERDRKAAELEAKRAQQEMQTNNYHDALRDIEDGNYTVEQGRYEFAHGKITTGQWTSLYQRLKADERRAEKAEADAEAFRLGDLLDPTDVKVQKAVDEEYKKLMQEEGADPVQTLFNVVQHRGVVPETAADFARAAAMNGNPEQRMSAYQMISTIDEMKPFAAQVEFKGNLLKDARYFQMYSESLGSTEALTALQSIQEMRRDPLVKDRYDEGLKLAAKNIKPKAIRATLDEGSGTLFGRPELPLDPVIGARIQSIAEDQYAIAYSETGDPKVAKKHALASIKEEFGVSRASGSPRIMAHPPENYYSTPSAPANWFETQFSEDVLELVDNADEYRSFDIVSDRTTASEATSSFRPTYAIIGMRADGTLEALPGRWQPDPTGPAKAFREATDALHRDPNDIAARRVLEAQIGFDALENSDFIGLDLPPLSEEDQAAVDGEKARRAQNLTLGSVR